MKSPWLAVIVVAAVALLRVTIANSDEVDKAKSVDDPMCGKEAGDVRNDNGLKMKLIWCPPGFFKMENVEVIMEFAPEEANELSDDDFDPKEEAASKPRKTTKSTPVKVSLSEGYWLGKYEVTQSEWKQVMEIEPWKHEKFAKEGAEFPATFVNWADAMEFCQKVTEGERNAGRIPDHWEYTLPTEAEWERACRARTNSMFSFGDDESNLGDYAWFRDTAPKAGEEYAHRVGQKKANAWGLFDMHGNVREWCRDVYFPNPPGGRDPDLKLVVKPGAKIEAARRVDRGGSWDSVAASCRSGHRNATSPDHRTYRLGFRVALSVVRSEH